MLLLLLLLLGPQPSGAHPGLKMAVSSKGLDYVRNVVTDCVQEELLTAVIPDIEGKVCIGIGNVHYALSQMEVVKVDLPQPSVNFEENVGVRVEVSGLSIAITGHWRTWFGIIKDGGTFELALFDVSSASLLQLGMDSQAHVSVGCLTCNAQIGRIDMRFHGGASFFLQTFVKLFPGYLKGLIEGHICPLLETQTGKLEDMLATMNVNLHIDPNMIFNLSLTNAPLVQSSNMEMDLKGVFYSEQHPSEPPFPSQDFQLVPKADYMISLGISQFSLNTYTYVCLTAGLLQINITDKMIPPVFPLRLNTSSFGKLIPQLAKMFPDMLMVLQVFAAEAPAVSLQMDSFSFLMSTAINAYAINNTILIPLFTLNLTTQFSGNLSIANEKVVGTLEFDKLKLSLVSSKIGTFQTLALEKVMVQGVKTFLIPALNAKLQRGIPLPVMKGVAFVQPVLQIQQGFLAVFSDVKMRDSSTEREL
ncbi:hypothetical protein ACEWY4_003734 [Coilia grayii]|uniref:Bactericidal permeability-increasing protein n=1 Tax=Coilia grayii TaxID=363190 RepID=A0ABD1KT77_9TELE